ncbi:MAG: single-stranded DNA-binding protein [Oscillospiraceae bacterium]|nr:single-stranded DNA-binding protein [Oscillospiraceae bacterium]
MYNRVILMGRLTRDPELRTTQNGIAMCRFSIAVERNFAKQGEERQTDFFDITVWQQQAEFVCKFFTKGRMIHVEGRLQNDNYTDNNGVKHYRTAIIAERISFCGDKRSDNGGGGQYGDPYSGQSYGGNQYQNQLYNGGGNQSYGNGGQQQYNNGGYNNGGGQYQQQPPRQQTPPPQANRAPQPIELGDLGDFEEILSDGEVPF